MAPALSLRAETYRILRPAAQVAIESLRGVGPSSASVAEANMLDVAFVALGLVALALMGAYAFFLRQL